MSFKVYIPARYASTRLPGKPLLLVGGKPIIEHVYNNALASGADEVVIATDDERIATAAERFGASVALTDPDHPSGTDRIAAAARARGEDDDTIVVNVQGDEPQLPAAVIRQVATLVSSDGVDIASVCEPVNGREAFADPNIVKVVRADDDRALYFSRAAIPHAREGLDTSVINAVRRHVGIYAYRVAYLKRFVACPPSRLEQIECLEQLRALSHNATIIVADAAADCGVGIDTQSDYERFVATEKHA